MHCEITDHQFIISSVKIQLIKENLKSVFWVSEFGHPNRYTSLPNGLNMSLVHELFNLKGSVILYIVTTPLLSLYHMVYLKDLLSVPFCFIYIYIYIYIYIDIYIQKSIETALSFRTAFRKSAHCNKDVNWLHHRSYMDKQKRVQCQNSSGFLRTHQDKKNYGKEQSF